MQLCKNPDPCNTGAHAEQRAWKELEQEAVNTAGSSQKPPSPLPPDH